MYMDFKDMSNGAIFFFTLATFIKDLHPRTLFNFVPPGLLLALVPGVARANINVGAL